MLNAGPALAGTATWDFTTDPTTLNVNPIAVYQSGFADSGGTSVYWKDSGGDPGGFLGLTWPLKGSSSIVLFPDIDSGKIVTSFTFDCDLRIGNPQQNVRAADGFSINFARSTDPVFQNHSSGDFATSGAVETGTKTGIAVSFDTWAGNGLPDGSDIEGIIVRVDNKTVLRKSIPTRNGTCDDITSLQTGPRDLPYWTQAIADGTMPDAVFLPGAWAGLCWKHLTVDLDTSSKLTVTWKGNVILDHFQTTFFPSAGGIVLAGRTGDADEHTHLDNMKLTTSAVTADTQKPTNPANLKANETGAYRVALAWDKSTDDSGRVAYEIEQDGTVLPGAYTDPTADLRGFAPLSTHTFRVRATDVSDNKSDWVPANPISVKTVADVDDANYAGVKIYGTTDEPISGTAVNALLSDYRYPDSPSRVERLAAMWMSWGEPGFAETYGDNYGARLAGTITPTETAQYRFFVRSDDASQLYLNKTGAAIPIADESSQICEESDCCEALVEPGTLNDDGTTSATSEPISLTAGKTYGILYVMKEGTGGDYGQVAWRKEGDTTAAASLPPISAPIFKSEVVPKADPIGGVVTFVKQPQPITAVANQSVTFSAEVTATSPYTTTPLYQWLKNGAVIPGAESTNYTIPLLAMSDNGAKYSFKVAVPGKAVTSSEALLTVSVDTVPPTIASATGWDTLNRVSVEFSEPVNATAGNFALSGGATVSSLIMKDPKTAVLTMPRQASGIQVTVTVNNITDMGQNKIAADSKIVFTTFSLKQGIAAIKFYDGISGTLITDMTAAPKFTNDLPDRIVINNTFETATWENGENYAATIQALVTAPETGNYIFHITADDLAEFYISTDDNPANLRATPSCSISGWTNQRDWANTTGGSTDAALMTSAPINLTAGKAYYMYARWKEGGGGDGTSIGWELPSKAGTIAVIPASALAWYAEATAPATGGKITFAKDASGKLVLTYEGTLQSADAITGAWTDVAGATSPYATAPSGAMKFFRYRK